MENGNTFIIVESIYRVSNFNQNNDRSLCMNTILTIRSSEQN